MNQTPNGEYLSDAVLDNGLHAVSIIGIDGKVLFASKRFYEGYSRFSDQPPDTNP